MRDGWEQVSRGAQALMAPCFRCGALKWTMRRDDATGFRFRCDECAHEDDVSDVWVPLMGAD